MKKIMFNDKYGLTTAVIEKRKTMTRRIATELNHPNISDISGLVIDDKGKAKLVITYSTGEKGLIYPHFQIGDIIAVAQPYKDIPGYLGIAWENFHPESTAGWNNKMFVKAKIMPFRIRITNIKVERLQDISEEDCQREGIVPITWRQWLEQDINDLSPQKYKDWDVWTLPKFIDGLSDPWKESDPDEYIAKEPRTAFAILISKLMGKKVWESNPWVFAYEFELMK